MQDWLDKKAKITETRMFEVCRIGENSYGLTTMWTKPINSAHTPREALNICSMTEFNTLCNIELISKKGTNYKKIQEYLDKGYIIYGVRYVEYYTDFEQPWYRVYALSRKS